MTKEIKLENVLAVLNDGVRMNDRELDKFNENYAKNPAYAFEWGLAAVEAAVKKQVTLRVIADLGALVADGPMRPVETLRLFAARAEEETMRRVLSYSRSTSPMANLVKDAERVAWAEIAKTLSYPLKAE